MILTEIFNDATPIPQDDGPHPVCSIDYPDGFVEAMGYLRAMLKKDERSGEFLYSGSNSRLLTKVLLIQSYLPTMFQ